MNARPPDAPRDRLLVGALIVALFVTVLAHTGVGYTLWVVESDYVFIEMPPQFRWHRRKKVQPRWRHGPVAFERRRIDPECTSIPECEPDLEPQVIELKIARLGMVEPDPTKLPEIQKYEEPELEEVAVNVEQEPDKTQPLPRQAFMRRKEQLDRRRQRRRKVKNMFNLDDDPRARATAFERIVGRQDGNPYGRGVDQEKFDTYFGKLAFELHRVFNPPTSLSRREIRKQLVRVKLTAMNSDGTIVSYRIMRRARHRGFTMAGEAALRMFMPAEGGQLRLPRPDAAILEFVNKRGIIIDLDGRLFR